MDVDMAKVMAHYGLDTPPLSSGWRRVKCPFHEDKSASASVCATGFNCHACGIKGNAVTLVAMVEGCSNKDAVDFLKQVDPDFKPGSNQIKMSTNGRGYKPKGRRGRLKQ